MKYKVMTFEEYSKIHHQTPYVFEVKSGRKRLVYFGVRHSHNPADPMFIDIVRCFKELKPNKVLVEGINDLNNPDRRDKILASIKNDSADKVIKEMGEPSFAVKLALEENVEVESPEPKYKDEIKYLLDQGFSKDSIFAHYIYRQISQYYRMIGTLSLEEYLQPYLAEFKRASDWSQFDYSFDNLKLIGFKIWGVDGDPVLNKPAWVDPIKWTPDQEHWGEVNLVSQQSSYFRDQYIIDRVSQALKDYDKILIVFGASHAVVQEQAIREIVNKYDNKN